MEAQDTCPVCSSENLRMRFERSHEYMDNNQNKVYRYKFIECRNCHLGYLNPIPGNEVMASLYNEEYTSYNYHYDPVAVARSLKYKIASYKYKFHFRKSLQNFFKTMLAGLVEVGTGKRVSYSLGIPLSLPDNSSIIDVGCGTGNWLLSMKEAGYENLSGYDIESNPKFTVALNQAGIQTYSGDFINLCFKEQFDCVRLEHVFEHLPNPHAVLTKCYELLKPGGVLVMTYPSMNSISRLISLEYSNDLDIPRHIFHHTRRSTKMVIEGAGFHLVNVKELGISSVFYFTLKSGFKKSKAMGIGMRILMLNPMFQPCYNIISLMFGKGENVSVFCKKPGRSS